MKFLLDTNVVSQIGKSKLNANALRWMRETDDSDLAISVVTVRELSYGAARAAAAGHSSAGPIADGVRRIIEAYRGRILAIDEASALLWGRMLADSNKHVDDTCLAAIAKVHGLTLVTRNLGHLRDRGVALLNPFTSPAEFVSARLPDR